MALESLPMRDRIVSEWTIMDERKRKTDRHWNRYFLGIMLQGMDGFEDDAAAEGDAYAYAVRFTPSREGNVVARKLGLGLTVDRGRWILPDGRVI